MKVNTYMLVALSIHQLVNPSSLSFSAFINQCSINLNQNFTNEMPYGGKLFKRYRLTIHHLGVTKSDNALSFR